MSDVTLQDLKDEDSKTLFEWINNKELVEFNSYFKPVNWNDHCKWFIDIRTRPGTKIFGIKTDSGTKLVGTCQLLNIHELTQSAELQIRIGYFEEMGKGIGSQAVHQLLNFGFCKLNLQRIYLHVFADNTRAYKSYIKNGFKEEGHLRRAAFAKGRLIDVKVMSILREEFSE